MPALDEGALDHVADYFRALSEPLRLRLLNALRDGAMNVGDLTLMLGCSQANVSKHLALLAKTGLVKREARGTSVFYEIADPRTYEMCDLVCGQIAQRLMSQVQGMTAFQAHAPAKPEARAGSSLPLQPVARRKPQARRKHP
jgi:DNA-binding transcriptional ArsR family regulator